MKIRKHTESNRYRSILEARGNVNYPALTDDEVQNAINKKLARKEARDDWKAYENEEKKKKEKLNALMKLNNAKRCVLDAIEKVNRFSNDSHITQLFSSLSSSQKENIYDAVNNFMGKYYAIVDNDSDSSQIHLTCGQTIAESEDPDDVFDLNFEVFVDDYSGVYMEVFLFDRYDMVGEGAEDTMAYLSRLYNGKEYTKVINTLYELCKKGFVSGLADTLINSLKKELLKVKLESVKSRKGNKRLSESYR